MKFHILAENNTRVEIEVFSRAYPGQSDYWDGNWVTSYVKIEMPGYSVGFNAMLRTEEIWDFLQDLKLMDSTLSGKAVLRNLDRYIHLECEMDRLGHIEWSGETCYPAGSGAVLNFSFESNQSYLGALIKELEDISLAFPVIGKPS
jgi:hypothetical protein